MSFEENRGQTDGRVKFLSHGQGYSMFLTSSGAVLSLQSQPSPTQPAKHAAIRMDFFGAKSATMAGEDQQVAKSSYFIGNAPAKWVTGAPNYARVRYRGLYPGVDLVFYGNQRQLEYDLVVAPGADPQAIRLQFDGVDGMRLDGAGNLVLSTALGDIRQHRPMIYQEHDGQRQLVDGRYVLQARHRVAFEIAKYDIRQALIIDPVLTFATYLGSTTNDWFGLSTTADNTTSPAVAVDYQGSVYLTGYNGGVNFPGPPVTLTAQGIGGGTDVFVVKMNSTGTALLYSVAFGGGITDVGGGIAVDASGNAYVTGYTNSTNFPVTAGAPQASLNSITGQYNAFVAEVNAAGTALVYSTYLGGKGSDWGRAIAVDHYGNAYVTGTAAETSGTNFPVTNGSSPTAGFLTEVNAAGTTFVYSMFLSPGIGYGVAVDGSGAAYVTGSTGTVILPTPARAYVLKVNAGGGIGYGPVYLGGSGGDLQSIGFGIAVDSQGDAYATGMTNDPNFPVTAGAAQTAYGGGLSDGFAVKLDPAGDLPPIYATYIGGIGSNLLPERGSGIGVDMDGYAYVSGTTECIGFPTTSPISGAQNGGPAVLMKGSVSGSSATWSASSLAGKFDQVNAPAFDSNGNIYAGTSAVNATTGGGVYKSSNGGSTWTAATAGITSTTIDAVAADPMGPNVYAIASGKIYLSTTGGASWTQLSPTVGATGSLAVARNSSATIYAGSSTGLIYSTNSGSTWNTPSTAPATPVNTIVADPNAVDTAYAGTGSGVYVTTNGGGNWTAMNTGLPTGLAGVVTSLAVTSASTVYAATPGGLYYLTSGGSTWTHATLGTIPSTPQLVAVDSGNNVYVAFAGAGMAVGVSGGTLSSDWGPLTYNGLAQNQIVALGAPPIGSGTPYAGVISATDAFLARISPNGSAFSFASCIGGFDNDLGQNIAVTPAGTVYVSGLTVATNFPTTPGVVQPMVAGGYDAFVARVDNVPFSDVSSSNAFFKFINVMYETGITGGCSTNPLDYCPNSTTNRGEMAVFIITAIFGGSNFTYTTTPYFTDVPQSNAFFKFIQKMKDLGITSGCSATTYCPNDPVTRGEMSVFIIKARYGTISFSYPTTPYFTDVPASNAFFSFIQKMAQTGITAGCGGGLYCPNDSLNRGQMAVFIITGLLDQLLPLTTPVVTQVTPNSGGTGTSATVTISGIGTHFSAGTTVTVPTGITASNMTVTNPTSLTVQLDISSGAVPSLSSAAGGPYTIVVTTGSEEADLPNGFIVQVGP